MWLVWFDYSSPPSSGGLLPAKTRRPVFTPSTSPSFRVTTSCESNSSHFPCSTAVAFCSCIHPVNRIRRSIAVSVIKRGRRTGKVVVFGLVFFWGVVFPGRVKDGGFLHSRGWIGGLNEGEISGDQGETKEMKVESSGLVVGRSVGVVIGDLTTGPESLVKSGKNGITLWLDGFRRSDGCGRKRRQEGIGEACLAGKFDAEEHNEVASTAYKCIDRCLLERGHSVHATVRNPDKCSDMLLRWNGGDRVKLFGADLQDEGSFDQALEGCDGVFHVASPMQFGSPNCEDDYVQANIIEPAVRGIINLLKSCSESKSIKRVVLTSSISTITAKDDSGKWKSFVDESCRISVDHVWRTKPRGWVYALSKLLTEEAAFEYAHRNSLDLVSVISPTIAGPFLTSTIPSSIQFLLSPITGDDELYRILSAVNDRIGSIALAHVEDICNAHIFLMEQPKPEGKYIGCAGSCSLTELEKNLQEFYPWASFKIKRAVDEEAGLTPPVISSEKLRNLGFQFKHGLEDAIQAAVSSCRDSGFLPPLGHYRDADTRVLP
ncbi:hypothetical protein MLD38_012706 [Melastoma candidum]|uniref:Uncharacterized protein n=1 Tax=Melastoma candidum TaxID=119954 RepID=A0ACB9RAU2_9MYRT|nr:hypothetical protein MLD38_012706 [Melastoma candidum]